MGRQVVTKSTESKQEMTLSTVAAASVGAAATELRLWVGNDALLRRTEWVEDLRELLNAWTDDGGPIAEGAATNFTTYRKTINTGKAGIVRTQSAAVPTVIESEVVITMGRDFTSSITNATNAGNRDGTRPGLTPYPNQLSAGAAKGRTQWVRGRFEKALERLLEDRKNN